MATILPYTHAAKRLKVDRNVLRRLIERNELPHVRTGRIVLVDLEETKNTLNRLGVGKGYKSRKRSQTVEIPPLIQSEMEQAWSSARLHTGSHPDGASPLQELKQVLAETEPSCPMCFVVRRSDATNQKSENDCRDLIDSQPLRAVLGLQSMHGDAVSHNLLIFAFTDKQKSIRFPASMVPWDRTSKRFSGLPQAIEAIRDKSSACLSVSKQDLLDSPFPYPRLDQLYLLLRHRYERELRGAVVRLQELCRNDNNAISGGLSPRTITSHRSAPTDTSPYLLTPSFLTETTVPLESLEKIGLSPGTNHRYFLKPGDIILDPLKPDASLLWQDKHQQKTAPGGAVLGPGLYRIRLTQPAEPLYKMVFQLPQTDSDQSSSRRLEQTLHGIYSFAEYWQALAVGTRGRRISMRDLGDMPVPIAAQQ